MTPEEKAKRYDEAIERARALNNGEDVDVKAGTTTCEYIFPELKESRDELTWLTRYIEEEVDSLSRDIRDDEDRIKLKNLKKSLAWLKKQGKKPQGKSALEAINKEKIDNQNCVKSTDKVGPKFHEGDWIVFNELTLYIKKIIKGFYITISKDGMSNSYDWDIDDVARLWTIQDAKNGDVLASDNGVIILVKESRNSSWGYRLSYHCAILYNGIFEPREFHVTPEVFFPATKEQRNFLFQKMRETGYKWNSKTKKIIYSYENNNRKAI